MKTLLLAPELFATDGGIPRIMRLYLKALCELAGPEDRVRFIALNDAVVDSGDMRRYANDRLDLWEACSRSRARFIRAGLRTGRRSDRIICGHVAQLPVAWAARCLKPRLRYYLVAHGIEVWRSFNLAERLALHGAHRIFCISDFTRRELQRNLALRPEQLVVLPNALDPCFALASASGDSSPPPDAPVILTISRLSQGDSYKGIDTLIAALPALLGTHPEVKLRVIGRGDDLPRLQALVLELKLGATVEFLGYMTDAEMRRELAACTFFALPSNREGFGLVFLEAMANGKPCLGANAGGTPEVINDISGRLTPYGDVAALAETCRVMLATGWDPAAIRRRATETFGFATFCHNLDRQLAS